LLLLDFLRSQIQRNPVDLSIHQEHFVIYWYLTSAHDAVMVTGEGKQSQMPGSLNSDSDPALVSGAEAAFSTRVNFTTVPHKAAQLISSFPVNNLCFIGAEDTHFASRLEAALSSRAAFICAFFV
jgi:hypothetical protein